MADDSLKQILRIRPLQYQVLSIRNPALHRHLFKGTCIAELRNLINVEMDIVETELRMPDPKKIPPVCKEVAAIHTNLDDILEDYNNTMEALALL